MQHVQSAIILLDVSFAEEAHPATYVCFTILKSRKKAEVSLQNIRESLASDLHKRYKCVVFFGIWYMKTFDHTHQFERHWNVDSCERLGSPLASFWRK